MTIKKKIFWGALIIMIIAIPYYIGELYWHIGGDDKIQNSPVAEMPHWTRELIIWCVGILGIIDIMIIIYIVAATAYAIAYGIHYLITGKEL